jgi:enamine deaminase RidA (YjgF/YER057c/UK114 family)
LLPSAATRGAEFGRISRREAAVDRRDRRLAREGMVKPVQRQRISSGSPYEPIIGFSRAVRAGHHVSVGGTAPIWEDGTCDPDPAAQARRCLAIIEAALSEAGAALSDVVRTRTYLVTRDDWETVGRVHGEIFGEVRPVSTMIVVSGFIDPRWAVEIEADAIVAT